jgi:hypothetical protein
VLKIYINLPPLPLEVSGDDWWKEEMDTVLFMICLVIYIYIYIYHIYIVYWNRERHRETFIAKVSPKAHLSELTRIK